MPENPEGSHGKTFLDFNALTGVPERRIGIAYHEGNTGAGHLIMTGMDGRIAESLLPERLQQPELARATTALVAGDFVHLYSEGNERLCQLACAASAARQETATLIGTGPQATRTITMFSDATGFVLADVAVGDLAEVFVDGVNTKVVPTAAFAGASLGQQIFLGITPGTIVAPHQINDLFFGQTDPSGRDYALQALGRIVQWETTAMAVSFVPGRVIRLIESAESGGLVPTV